MGAGTEIGRDVIERNKNNWGTDLNIGALLAPQLNETACFPKNDAVSYIKMIKKKRREKGQTVPF